MSTASHRPEVMRALHGVRHGLFGPGAAGLLAVRHGGEGDLGAFARQDILHMGGAHVAHADDAEFYLFHGSCMAPFDN